jgi:1-acyl-sn-glycerol-3-phosphate acyltransferase
MTWSRRYVLEVRGLEKVAPEADPFLFVANHSQRLEAVLLPALLIFHRRGKLVHFLADWPTLLVPGAGLLLRRSGAITVASKSARWPILNRLRPLFAHPEPAFERARRALLSGSPVGIFPEATMNRDPRRLLRGQTGAARLALRTGVPVVPAGIRFPAHDLGPDRPIADREPMVIEIGDPIAPPVPAADAPPERGAVRELHALVMTELARLSGKSWTPQAQRRRY